MNRNHKICAIVKSSKNTIVNNNVHEYNAAISINCYTYCSCFKCGAFYSLKKNIRVNNRINSTGGRINGLLSNFDSL